MDGYDVNERGDAARVPDLEIDCSRTCTAFGQQLRPDKSRKYENLVRQQACTVMHTQERCPCNVSWNSFRQRNYVAETSFFTNRSVFGNDKFDGAETN